SSASLSIDKPHQASWKKLFCTECGRANRTAADADVGRRHIERRRAASQLGAPVSHEVLRIEGDAVRSGRTDAQAPRHRRNSPFRKRRITRSPGLMSFAAMDGPTSSILARYNRVWECPIRASPPE